MIETDIIAIRYYIVFDPNSINIGNIRSEIIVVQFELKPLMFQMLQAIGKYIGVATYDPYLHLR